MMWPVAFLPMVAVAVGWLTGAVRRYALARSVLDEPNERSSHTVPTPRGGGLAIVCVFLTGVAVAAAAGILDSRTGAALLGGGALVAAVGWVDDHADLPASWRAAAHLLAAAWALAWIGGMETLDLGVRAVHLGWLGWLLGALAIVWVTNLFNFMDGIDGIAASEALAVGAAGGGMLWWAGSPDLAVVAWLLAAAASGFLWWNWPPARIFMGDVGSYLLGYTVAVLAIASEARGAVPLLVWLLLGGVFVFDATATLLRRLARGDRVFEAHRSHAYQRATQAGFSHRRVTTAVLALNGLLALLGAIALALGGWALPASLIGGGALLVVVYRWVEAFRPM